METRGRGRTTVQVRANETLGEALMAGASCTQTTESPKKTPYPKAVSPVRQSPPKPSTKAEKENDLTVKSEGIPTRRSGSPMSVSSRTSSVVVVANEAEIELMKKELQEAKAKIEELVVKKEKEELESKGE